MRERGVRGEVLKKTLEICAQTLQACSAAEEGGADRIELCAALGEGGVSPSRGLIEEALKLVETPVHVLVRPRTGDFCYDAAEFRAICRDAEDALAAGAAGIVVGMLNGEGELDVVRLRELVKLSGGGMLTFHRAFDQVGDLARALEGLIELGFDRVLTSGGALTVDRGFARLEELVELAEGRIRIAAGGGVTLENAARVAAVAGLDLHASLRAKDRLGGAIDPLWNADEGSISVEMVRVLSGIVRGAVGVVRV